MTARYLLCPGTVRSCADGDWHHVSASQLAMLYGVPLGECLVLPASSGTPLSVLTRSELLSRADLIRLTPRHDGNYTLPAPPRPANPYACHNREPFKPEVSLPDGHSFTFRMAPDCRYTLSSLGQADQRCAGCKWRADLPQTPASS